MFFKNGTNWNNGNLKLIITFAKNLVRYVCFTGTNIDKCNKNITKIIS